MTSALEQPNISEEAVKKVLDERFGKKRVIFDPTDHEANNIAVSKGYTVIKGRSLSKDVWTNVKKFEAALPAGKVTPSPKPFSPDGEPVKVMPEDEYPEDIENMVEFCKALYYLLLGSRIRVVVINDKWNSRAAFGPGGTLYLGYRQLGRKFFTNGLTADVLDLLIHEAGHWDSLNHLSEEYYDALTKYGAKMTRLALEDPDFFYRFDQTFDKVTPVTSKTKIEVLEKESVGGS